MMMQCPKCGAIEAPSDGAIVYFVCGTYLRLGTDDVGSEGKACLENQIRQRDAKLAEKEKELEAEQARWQDAIYSQLCADIEGSECFIDGSGCESGDPLDVTLCEIRQGVTELQDRLRVAAETIAEKDAEIERLKKIADAAEWVWGVDGRPEESCPICENTKEQGHAPDCLYDVEAAKTNE